MADSITPGAPKSVDLIVADYTDPLNGAVATGLTVTAVLSDTPHGAAIDPGCSYSATEIGPASAPYTGTIYRFTMSGSSTATPLSSRTGRRVYLSPSVNGNPVDRSDVVELVVTA